jgi:hypothetical protein
MVLRQPEICLLGFSAVILLSSFAWFVCLVGPPATELRIAGGMSTAVEPDVILADSEWTVAAAHWLPPKPQSRSGEWIYDVFTPPEIFYDESLKEFRVTPQAVLRSDSPASATGEMDAPPDLELVDVKWAMFRLQLIGYFTSGGEVLGLFENRITSETFLARSGRALPELGLVVSNVELQARRLSLADNTAINHQLAVAVIRDQLTGEAITLNSNERCFSTDATAIIATNDALGAQREFREGGLIGVGGVMYKILEIQISPPHVVISPLAADQATTSRHTLRIHAVQGTLAAPPSI